MIYSFGSVNMDLVCQAPQLPQAGETLLGQDFQMVPGGKGANQAVAAARLGAPTAMVGRVGDDAFGRSLRASLAEAGVNIEAVQIDPGSSGIASIVVDGQGQNQIVVVPGANGRVSAADAQRFASTLKPQDVLLLQFEIPLEAVAMAAQLAHQQGATVILDPAPACDNWPSNLTPHVHILTPNQGEVSALVGRDVADVASAQQAAQQLHERGTPVVIVKLGAEGVVVTSDQGCFHQPAIAVQAIDTVAAGDAFNGGLAVAISEGKPLTEAVSWATAVAAHAVTQRGAQSAMPTRSQLMPWLDRLNPAIALEPLAWRLPCPPDLEN